MTVCTHGRSFYMQTVWRVLDPDGALIPQQDWAQRLRCARPDDVDLPDTPLKTPLFGTGVASLWDDSLDVRFGPLVIVEDNEEVRGGGDTSAQCFPQECCGALPALRLAGLLSIFFYCVAQLGTGIRLGALGAPPGRPRVHAKHRRRPAGDR